MKNDAFNFMLKALLVCKIFKFCPDVFDHVRKQLDKQAKVNFTFYDITDWTTNHRQPVKTTRQKI